MPVLDADWLLGVGGGAARLSQTGLAFAVTPERTLLLAAGGEPLVLTVTAPASVAGTAAFAPSDLSTGPVPIIPPGLGATPAVGAAVDVRNGIWAHEGGADAPSLSWQWRADGADIPGATLASYTPDAGQAGASLSVVETATGASGARSAESGAQVIGV